MKLLAEDIKSVFGTVSPPPELKNLTSKGGEAGISTFLTNVIGLIYTVGAIAFLFMLIIGAFQWITSGGDKEALGKAKARITHALIGIVLLALAFVIATIIGQVTGFSFYKDQDTINRINEVQNQVLDPRDKR